MGKWIVEPLFKVKDIYFGMKREQVRSYMGENYKEFRKSKFSKNTTDDYGMCHIYYDQDNKCEAIELFDSEIVVINEVTIFPADLSVIKQISSDFKEDYGSYISTSKSIGIYAPVGKMESILFGRANYYL